jgi:hypothetical protein
VAAGRTVYKMTDETLPPISMCVIAATAAAYGTGIKPLTSWFKKSRRKKEQDVKMNKFGFAAAVVSGVAAAIIGLAAPAAAAPTGPGSAQQTISELQAQGYTVIVNRIGAAPLDQATVVAVRPGQTYSRTDTGVPGAGNDIYTTITNKTVYVDVK